MRRTSVSTALAMLALLGGCASDPLPSEQMRLTERALQQARAVGASEEIDEMRLAEQKFARAGKNIEEGDFKRARDLAEQAELDARLAEARVLKQRSDDQLAELRSRIARLRKQLGGVQ